MRTIVLVTGATAAIWVASHSPLVKVWAEAVFSNQVLVDTGHPGSYELAKVPPSKLAHIREYHWDVGAVPAIDDRPRQPKDRYRTLCGRCKDRSPGFDAKSSTLMRASELRTDLAEIFEILDCSWGGLRVSPLFFFCFSLRGSEIDSNGLYIKVYSICLYYVIRPLEATLGDLKDIS